MEYAYLSKTTGEILASLEHWKALFPEGEHFLVINTAAYINLLWKMFLNFKFQKNTPINLN